MDAETEIAAIVAERSAAIRERDLDRLMRLYAESVVSYDLVPPLEFDGRENLSEIFARWLGGYSGQLGITVEGLSITVQGDLAFAYWLNRTQGTLTSGGVVDYWARATICCVRRDEWEIVHEHLSLPVDFVSGEASMHLAPASVDIGNLS
ncbi:MAG TPA: nuclear transport factor 2 family protein [Galbitalea sp.]|jgi:ketosteroid isomerase-like protein|nr:nuclear transport factor 2 family protein [Galbitalea sp.]